MSDLQTGQNILMSIKAEPTDFARYLVFADWLRDRGRHDLAYAYEWAGRRGFYPYRSPGQQRCWWGRQKAGRRSPNNLPQILFDSIRPRPGRVWQCRTWEAAFERLAELLRKIRQTVALGVAR
jgi:uncharacterized protein (TIGR02996 family)